jgi:PilX N-terminal
MKSLNIAHNNKGNTIVIVLLIMALLTFVGIATTTFTTTEMQTATNDMHSKRAFYIADGATEVASELLEASFNCSGGFSIDLIGDVFVEDSTLYENPDPPPDPTDTDRDLYFPANYVTGPHTNVNMGGSIGRKDSSLPMASGYERLGKSSVGGGTYKLMDIVVQHEGPFNTTALVRVQWRHVIGQEDPDCLY